MLPDPADKLQWYRACAASEVPADEIKGLRVHNRSVALFYNQMGELAAVDNRCPHMGYPMSKGSLKDGILTCHWHHWQFEGKTGACFVTGGDDLPVFPVQVRDNEVFIGFSSDEERELRERLRERGERTLQQAMKDANTFLIAKAVTSLRECEDTPAELVYRGLYFGVTRTSAGWSSGLAILTIAANLWNEVRPEDQNLLLIHGFSQIANKNAGRSSRRQQFPFPGRQDVDTVTLKRWFRRFVEQRNAAGVERILMTLHDRGHPKAVIADFLFTAATDYYYTGDGHALDFANKAIEALDFIQWRDAGEILRPIAIDLITRTRHEETEEWSEGVALSEPIFAHLEALWKENQAHSTPLDMLRFARLLLGEDLKEIILGVEQQLRQGVPAAELCRALVFAAALRVARFHLKNEGDWHAVANLYSYGHALYRAFQIAPSPLLLRGLFHGATACYLTRWLNMPRAHVPDPGEFSAEEFSDPESMLNRLQELADFQKVYASELLVNQFLAQGFDPARLRKALIRILLREDSELHMFQVLEVAFAQCDLTQDKEEQRIHLLAATRYITAQKVMKAILWSAENAERLQKGELLSEREDDN